MQPCDDFLACQTWRRELQTERQSLAQRYRHDGRARDYLNRHSLLIDGYIRTIWDALALEQQASLLAVGGYGRGQLFPCSDIDLLILLPAAPDALLTDTLTRFVGLLWDIGLEVGHSVRTVAECLSESQADLTVETTLLENRLLCGNPVLFTELNQATARVRDPLRFLEGKLIEQTQRHNRLFSGTSNLEPNLKDSPGGLRDLHTIIWLARAIGLGSSWDMLVQKDILTPTEARMLRISERQLEKLRIELHLQAKRREDRLIFDLQQQTALAMGYADAPQRRASEEMMQAYYKASRMVSQLSGILLPNIRALLFCPLPRVTIDIDSRFYRVNDMLGIHGNDVFEDDPGAILEAFLHMQRHPELTGMAPRTLRALWRARRHINERFRRNRHNRALFLQMFRENGLTHTLRRMNLYGVLGKYLPAFGRIIGRMQHDLFHVYTVEEHILMVVRNLRRFAVPAFNHEYPLLSRLITSFERPEVLYIAGLFHDIAKGRGGDHSQLGTVDAAEFCQTHGLSFEDRELIVWLVREHLSMSTVAQKQDIYDPETVLHFAETVGNPRRLAALYLLTVADIRGTSPKIWNGWKAKLLEDLYHATLRVLESGGEVDCQSVISERQAQARAELRLNALPEGVEMRLWQQLDTVYFLRHDVRTIAWHARVLNRLVDSPTPIVKARMSESREGIEVLVYTPDQSTLFSRICAFFGRTHYSIADARVHTTRHGYALDTFHVFIPEHHADDYRAMINFIEFELAQRLLSGETAAVTKSGRIDRHLKHFPIQPQVSLHPDDKALYYVLSIVAGDRPGLLARISQVLAEHRFGVHSAKIMTLGSRVEDSFLLSADGGSDDKSLLALESALTQALQL
ncbi:[protein-PII] uridylyltransferase [Craterilacuibacter sinensis]|uniref:Bifunctional uridylyltransferase/uridylyl-removing enzyme n=1 Tax=Craterilacuibacter sinensis TaxID=2686017 RepID=A0A845BZ70_9NEIS|nr:[protein-PII] uridylyltransferase [Craterilacuibacter sinensis]MXR37803.1 [protein-PII] uridylyltransferase [Craterilacuibacter sinensis]